ncbi:MAG: alpha/beta fold hydrolase, partial [Magnetospirillum sp.]|nr:alpha/beta fold hydrolase [Magnetospirillum sp.]
MELNVHSKSVHAAHWGESINPALVMVHGAGGNHAVWSLVAPNVAAEGYYVLAPDLPGHGLSEGEALTSIPALADWLTAFLDAAGLQRVILAGHSMGA